MQALFIEKTCCEVSCSFRAAIPKASFAEARGSTDKSKGFHRAMRSPSIAPDWTPHQT